ncbi:hypothetical protein AA0481_2177 [Acetobacter orientalis NRIC 0481]|nr:hypothetical protein AA0481_2177 [Acetobacter orientalis NRIC 0481]
MHGLFAQLSSIAASVRGKNSEPNPKGSFLDAVAEFVAASKKGWVFGSYKGAAAGSTVCTL